MNRTARLPTVAVVLAAALSTHCTGVTGGGEAAPVGDGRQRNEPEWVRTALTQSADMMENRCVELAPLDLLYTADPTFEGCMVDAMVIAAHAWQKVYEDALNRCVSSAKRSGTEGCCFAKITDRNDEVARRQTECDDECARRTSRKQGALARSKVCQPEAVSPPRRGRSRAHTPAVVEIVSRCQRGTDEAAACSALPTYVERAYCGTYCEAERSKFNLSLAICSRAAEEPGGAVRCNLEDPAIRGACETRCREQPNRIEMR